MYTNKNTITFKVLSALMIFFFASSLLPHEAFAARSRAGGGEVPSFDAGDLAKTAGMTVGMFVVGQTIGPVINSAASSAWDGIKGALGGIISTTADTTGTVIGGQLPFGAATSSIGSAAEGSSFLATVETGLGGEVSSFAAVGDIGSAVGSVGTKTVESLTPYLSMVNSSMAAPDFVSSVSALSSSSSSFGPTVANAANLASSAGSILGGQLPFGAVAASAGTFTTELGKGILGPLPVDSVTSAITSKLPSPASFSNTNLFSLPADFAVSSAAQTTPLGLGQVLMNSLENTFSSPGLQKTLVKGFSTYVVTNQASRAMSAMGRYYKWAPETIYVASGIAVGATAGFMNPDVALARAGADSGVQASFLTPAIDTGSFVNMAKGAFVGAMSQAASGLVITAIDGDQLAKGKSPGAFAQLTGLVAGAAAGNFAKELVNPAVRAVTQLKQVTQQDIENLPTQEQRDFATESLKNREAVYARVTDVSMDGKKTLELYRDFSELIPENIKPIKAGNLIKFYDVDPGISASGLFKATVTNTLDMWPNFAAKAVGYTVANMLGNGLNEEEQNKNPMATLGRTLGESVGGALFSNVAGIYGLRPGLYLGTNADVMDARLNYNAGLGNLIVKEKGAIIKSNIDKGRYNEIDFNKSKIESEETISGKLGKADLTKLSLLTTGVKDSLVSGVVESGIRGGIQAALQSNSKFNQQSPNYSPINALLVSNIENIGMAIVRGAGWNMGWSSEQKWHSYSADPKPEWKEETGNNLPEEINNKLADYNYFAFKSKLDDYNATQRALGATERTIGKMENGRRVSSDITQMEVYADQKTAPSLGTAIDYSIRQATLEAFAGTFGFGIPTGNPERVSSLNFLQYTNALKYKAHLGLTRAISDSAVDANLNAAANSVIGTIAQIESLSKITGITPERFIRLNGAPNLPYTLQYRLPYDPTLNYYKSSVLLKFPTEEPKRK